MNTLRDTLKGLVLGLVLLSASWAIAGGVYPPQGGGSSGPLSTGDLAEVLGVGNTTGGTDLSVADGDSLLLAHTNGSGSQTRGGTITSDLLWLPAATPNGMVIRGADATGTNFNGGGVSIEGGDGDGSGNGGLINFILGDDGGSGTEGEIRIESADGTGDVHLAVSADGVVDFNNELGGGGDGTVRLAVLTSKSGTDTVIKPPGTQAAVLGDSGSTAWAEWDPAVSAGLFHVGQGDGATITEGEPGVRLFGNGAFHSVRHDTATNSAVSQYVLARSSTGTTAEGFGSRILWYLEAPSGGFQNAALIDGEWSSAGGLSSRMKFRVGNNASGADGAGRDLLVIDGATDTTTLRTDLAFAADDTYDIGSSSAEVRTVYVQTSLVVNGTTWLSGSGSPEGAVTAPVGSLYTRTDGGADTTLYVKESGTGNTGWAAK